MSRNLAQPTDVTSSALNVETTNFEFDIEANRRRRAEIASDVDELLSISKFFLQHYSSDAADKTWSRLTNSASGRRSAKDFDGFARNAVRPRAKSSGAVSARRQPVAIVTPPCGTCKQTAAHGLGSCQAGDVHSAPLPPLGEHGKLHDYCVSVVDEFFQRPMTGRSVPAKGGKQLIGEKWVQRMNQVKSQYNAAQVQRNPRYASTPARYLAQRAATATAQRTRLFPPNSLVSQKSRQILEKIVRKGVEIKKHSCLTPDPAGPAKKAKGERIRSASAERPTRSFKQMHPNIELVASHSVFPRRVLKQSSSCSALNGTATVQVTASAELVAAAAAAGTNRETITGSREATKEKATEPPPDTGNRVDEGVVLSDELPGNRSDASLQLRQLPSLSIKPRAQCKVENVYAIEIKANAQGASGDGGFLRNNEVHEFIYRSSGSESISDKHGPEAGEASLNGHDELQSEHREPRTADNRNLCTIDETSHINDDLSLAEHSLNDSHASNGDQSRGQNNSPASLLTDDEKTRSDLRLSRSQPNAMDSTFTDDTKTTIDGIDLRRPTADESRHPVRMAIDEILHSEELARPADGSALDEFDDLREVLHRIRNDQTTMDVELQRQQQQIARKAADAANSTTTLVPTDESIASSRRMHDQAIQCDSLASSQAYPVHDRAHRPPGHSTQSGQVSAHFSRVHDSHRSSSIDSAELNIYRSATRKQVKRAAKTFLRSILEDSESANASRDECDDSSCINLKIERQKYVIVEDRLMRSRLNVMPEQTDESTSNEMPSFDWNVTSHPGNGSWQGGSRDGGRENGQDGQHSGAHWTNAGNYSTHGHWEEASYSDTETSTDNSVSISIGRRAVAYQDSISMSVTQRRAQQQQRKQHRRPHSYMSEGEILSDGEARCSS